MGRISRITFNNFLIIGILIFISIVYLPVYIRGSLIQDGTPKEIEQVLPSGVIALVPEHITITALQFPTFTLTKGKVWKTDSTLDISATQLANRWISLTGTEISTEIYDRLKVSLMTPSTLKVYRGKEGESYRLNYYELPTFWLIQNWENRWFAVSVESHYLFPVSN
ncbi:hypothetical protein [Candidatus Enterovibrio escicola]|uniref:Uncharacterized protein n=1 Tax=Candidatus Enterovibrio escicola TaxID=1927127 RepID=A0A2A5T4S3_9GAMM|nr:hypothetical protein [Candidatus Enterovibrio escacola]PCS23151.1 hypothetical protein BTN49_1147 [Candidatus Enterovibrio escacola]